MPRRSRSGRSVLVAALAAATIAATIAATCGPSPRPSPGPGPSPEGPPDAGTIRIAFPAEPGTLNPVTDPSPVVAELLRPVLPSLHTLAPDGEYRPALLAEEPSVSVTGDRMEVAFRLRGDARWSDGTPITTEDVAFTWRTMTDPDIAVADRWGFDRLREVRTVSATEGALVLEPPLASWRDLFSAGRFVLPAHAGPAASWNEGPPVAAGPFAVAGRVRGRSVTLERIDGAGAIEAVFVPDPTTALQLLERGIVDVLAPMPGLDWGRSLDGVEGVQVAGAFGPTAVHLLVSPERIPEGADRAALIAAIDRERFVEVAGRGDARPLDGVLVPEQEGALPAWEGLAGGARVSLGRELELVHVRSELPSLLGRYVRQELEGVGADVDLLGVDADVFVSRFLTTSEFDLAIWESRGSPSPWLARWFGEGGVVEAPGLDRLLARADGGEALSEAQRALAGSGVVVPLLQPRVMMAWREGIEGVRVNPTAEGPLWNVSEWRRAAGGSV